MRKIRLAAVAVIMLALIVFPSVISSAVTCGEMVRNNTEAALQAVDYEMDEKVAELLAPSRYSFTDITNKRLEIADRDDRKFLDVSEEEALEELRQDNVHIMSFGEAFETVQGEIGRILQQVVDGSAGAQDKGVDFFTQKILQNKEKLLLGLAYIERLYDFNMGAKNIKDVLIYEPGAYGMQVDVLDWLIKIGSAGGETLKISNNNKVFGYGKLFGDVTAAASVADFLEQNRQQWIPNTPIADWFLQESRAFIIENISSWDQSPSTKLYSRLSSEPNLQSHILPLLTVSEDSIYVIANSCTITYGIVDCYVDRKLKEKDPIRYEEKRTQFLEDLEHIAGQQRDFIDLWHRLVKPEVQGKLRSNRIVLDSLRMYTNTTTSASEEWSAKIGTQASQGVREFFTPLNLYDTFMFSDGMAAGEGIRYYLSKALTERGLATYAHELTHLLVSPVMLNGYGARDGMQAEVYARGMFEPYELNDPPAFNLNLIFDRQAYSDRLHNAAPGRFQDETDLQAYMSGLLDVVYTLDYAEADVMLSKTPEDKKKWFHKLEQIEDTKTRSNQGDEGSKHNLDSVRELTLDEAGGLNTIDDLIRNNIIVSRYEVNGTQTTGTLLSNGYYVVPLFSANYAGVQNDGGVSGDVMIRRQAFELLAEYGYYNGIVPYISNQYKESARADQTILSDTYILNKIFGDRYGTMAEFKKAMFQKRIEKAGKLKPVTIQWNNQSVEIKDFNTLRQQMKEAVEADLERVHATSAGANNIRAHETQVERLKEEIFRAYLYETEDFKRSVYDDGNEPASPTHQPDAPTHEPTAPTNEPATPSALPTITPSEWPSATPSIVSPLKTSEPSAAPSAIAPADFRQGEENKLISDEKPLAANLLLASVVSFRSRQTIRWNSVESADGYYIYGAKSHGRYKRLRIVSKRTCKWNYTGLKEGASYKYYVAAYKIIGGKREVLSKSLPVYSATKGGKYGNPLKIRANKRIVNVKSGKKIRLKVKVTGIKMKKADRTARYIMENPAVAEVSKKGVITGVRRGTCYIYCVARNGLFQKVKVKVS